jgi:hypothetical protein
MVERVMESDYQSQERDLTAGGGLGKAAAPSLTY